MTEIEPIVSCEELYTKGMENITKQLYDEQSNPLKYPPSYEKSTLNEIKDLLSVLCVVEPISQQIKGKELFRISHFVYENYIEEKNENIQHLKLDNIKNKDINVYLDENDFYIKIGDDLVWYDDCPPGLFDIIRMWLKTHHPGIGRKEMYKLYWDDAVKEFKNDFGI